MMISMKHVGVAKCPSKFLKKSLTVRARPVPMPRSYNMNDFGMRNGCPEALNFE